MVCHLTACKRRAGPTTWRGQPMDDQQRLAALRQRLDAEDGLDEETFARLSAELDRGRVEFGHDEQGRLKVAVYDAKSYDVESLQGRNQDRFALHFLPARLDEDTVGASDGYKAICVFVNDVCDAEVIGRLAALGVEFIALRCAGFNNIDLDACREHGISAARVPEYSPYAVAEHTIGLMLMLNRKLHHAYQRNRIGYFVLEGLTGFDMRGKTVGVVGTGKIGRCAVNILLGFGCRVVAVDKFPDQDWATDRGVEYVDMETLLRESDIITLHAPLFPETHHLIDAAAIERMKPGAMLINTSRGGLVDAKALIQGLKSGKVGAAGLDVYEEEAGVFFQDLSGTVLTDDVLARLLTFNNVVVTSHQAYLTHEALRNIADVTFANLQEFQQGVRGRELTNSVLPKS
ncbi:MAG: 2-hydroxyacid dehydrogenase [Planctomycetales bacterium]